MNAWHAFLRPWSTCANLVILVVLSCVLFGCLQWRGSQFTTEKLPEAHPRSAADLNDFLSSIKTEGRTRYLWSLLFFDIVFSLCYALQMSLWLMLFDQDGKRSWLLMLPIIVLALDWLENFALAAIIGRFQEGRADSLAGLAATFTVAKWTMVAITVMAIVSSGVLQWRQAEMPQ